MASRKVIMILSSVVLITLLLMTTLILVLAFGNASVFPIKPTPVLGPIELPKAPHWDVDRKCFYFVDVYRSTVHRYDPASGVHKVAKVGDQPLAFVIPIKDSADDFIISYGPHVAIISWDGESENISEIHIFASIGQNVYRANEGKVAPSGTLFIGEHSHFLDDGITVKMNNASLYAFYKNGTSKKILENVTVANGMGWSLDGKKFFFIDSLGYTVESFTYNAKDDSLSNRTLLCNFKKENIPGVPDGMAIDNDDKLWITAFSGHKVIRIDPEKHKIIEQIELDSLQITSAVFGGTKLKDFYITSGKYQMTLNELKNYPHAGYIYQLKDFEVQGCPGVSFNMS